jgi:hypothetical protein
MTDAQVADEKFLVLINDLLASGEIPDLFPDDEIENIINGMRNEVKGLFNKMLFPDAGLSKRKQNTGEIILQILSSR